MGNNISMKCIMSFMQLFIELMQHSIHMWITCLSSVYNINIGDKKVFIKIKKAKIHFMLMGWNHPLVLSIKMSVTKQAAQFSFFPYLITPCYYAFLTSYPMSASCNSSILFSFRINFAWAMQKLFLQWLSNFFWLLSKISPYLLSSMS